MKRYIPTNAYPSRRPCAWPQCPNAAAPKRHYCEEHRRMLADEMEKQKHEWDDARMSRHGRRRATSIPSLAAATRLSEREVRAALADLLNLRRIPVVTLACNPGVFIAETPEELDLADKHLRGKTMALLRRRRALRLCRVKLTSETLF